MKFTQLLLTYLLVCLTTYLSFAQNRACSTPEVLENMLKIDPAMQGRMEAIERHTQAFTQRDPSAASSLAVT